MIRFETSLGDFTIELFEKEAPESVASSMRRAGQFEIDTPSPAAVSAPGREVRLTAFATQAV